MATTDSGPDSKGSVFSPSHRAHPHLFDPPERWTLTQSWQRAQTERDRGGPVNKAERMVWLTKSDKPKRVFWALQGASLRCKCSCRSFQYRSWCCHVASLWWRWVRDRIDTFHIRTGRRYTYPPCWLRIGETADIDVHSLTPAELDAWLHTVRGHYTQRQWADATDRSHGTVGNLVRRAKWKLGGVRR